MINFKRDFINRYENQQLPLSFVLDAEVGIGFGERKDSNTPLLDDLYFQKSKNNEEVIKWNDFDAILHEKLYYAFSEKATTINLSVKDFENLPEKWNDLPDTFSSIIELYSHSNNEKIYIKNAGGSSATNLLGRFAYGDNELFGHLKKITEIEERVNAGKIIAELVHLPEARTGNILQRKNVRNFEIPYLGNSSLGVKSQINIDDILVSVKNNKILLISKKYKKEIITRLSNAHNFDYNSLPVYQFLCDLQTQNKRSGLGFYWNPIFLRLPFLPRVEFQNIIFSKARWTIKTEEIKELFEKEDLILSIKKWKKKLQIPDYVELIDGDNRLLIYLLNITSVNMLYQTIKKRKRFVLEEFLFSDKEIVQKKEEFFCNQFVVSYYNKEKLTDND